MLPLFLLQLLTLHKEKYFQYVSKRILFYPKLVLVLYYQVTHDLLMIKIQYLHNEIYHKIIY